MWAIGVDSDQYELVSPELQPYILTSMLKKVDVATFDTISAFDDGSFAAGVQVFNVASDGVGYSTSGGFVDDIADQLDDFAAQIAAGDITVPEAPLSPTEPSAPTSADEALKHWTMPVRHPPGGHRHVRRTDRDVGPRSGIARLFLVSECDRLRKHKMSDTGGASSDTANAPSDTTDAPIAIQLTDIVKRFPGVVANDGVNLTVRQGSVHAIVGENGAGKSTLMKTLYGAHQPNEGTITVNGRERVFSSPKDAIADGIGMVFQAFMLAANLTVWENIVLGQEPGTRFARTLARRST